METTTLNKVLEAKEYEPNPAWCAANAAAWWVVGNTVSLKPKKEVWQEAFDEARFHQRVKFIDMMMQEG